MVTDGAGEAVAPSQCASAIRNGYAGDNTPLGSCNTNELREVARRWRARRCRGEGASRAMVHSYGDDELFASSQYARGIRR